MFIIGRPSIKVGVLLIAVIAAAALLAISGAGAPDPNDGGPYPYPTVLPLPAPSLRPWIVQFSPTGMVETLSQIRVRFANPMIPLEAIESPDEQTKLKYFEITPALPGTWRFVAPHMAIFEFNRALPIATRIKITLRAGLGDLSGNRLLHDVAWTFETRHLSVDGPISSGGWDIRPTIAISSNAEIDIGALRVRTRLIEKSSGASIPFSLVPMPSPSPELPRPFLSRVTVPQEHFQAHDVGSDFQLKPLRTLAKNTTYRLSIEAGIMPIYGNMPSTDRYTADLTTYAPLSFDGAVRSGEATSRSRASARFTDGTIELQFNNDLDPKSVTANITLSPKPIIGATPQPILQVGGDLVDVNPWVLQPRTRYTVTIRKSLEDTWHQTLGRTVVLEFTTDDLAADFSTLDGWRVYPSTLGLRLPANVLSLPGDAYQAAYISLRPESLVYSAYENMPGYINWHVSGEPPLGLPPVLQWPSITASGTASKPTSIDLGLASRLKGPYGVLEYGMTARILGTLYDMPDSLAVTTGRINVTNLGLFAQVMPHEAIALVHRLNDGAPVRDARVDFFIQRSELADDQPRPCATAKTDDTGMALLDAPAVRRCAPWHETRPNEQINGPQLIVIASKDDDWTAAAIGTYGMGDQAVAGYWNDSPIISLGSMFSDRGLYQPGERASFEAYAFHLQDGILRRDEHVRFALSMRSPDGSTRDLGSATTNEFGAFPFTTTLPAMADLGDYALVAKSDTGVVLNTPFRIAEFKPPNFKVAISVDKSIAIRGETVVASGQSDYLFGQPVDNAKTRIVVTRSQTSFVPAGWEERGYSWFEAWWPESAPVVPAAVLDVTGKTDVAGAVRQPIPVATDLPYPMQYTAEQTTTDVSNLVVANSTYFNALPSPVLIGVSADYLVPAGKPLKALIVTTDPHGAPVGAHALRVTLTRIDWDDKGNAHLKDESHTEVVTRSDAAVAAALVPKAAGWYRLRANFAGAPARATETDRDLWVYGPGEVAWTNSDDGHTVSLQLDHNKYEPGDRATVLVKSPFADADLYLAVVRQGSLWRTHVHVAGSAPTFSFVVTPQMLPYAQIEAVLVRRGAPIESFKPGTITSLARFGSAGLVVNLDRRYLKVAVKPLINRPRPGAMETVDLQLVDYAGSPVRGQATVMVADESILQLNGYRTPDLVAAVYGYWPINVAAGDNRLAAALQQPQPSKLDLQFNYGSNDRIEYAPLAEGGTRDVYAVSTKTLGHVTTKASSSNEPGAAVRINFQQLAYFNGDVRTDDHGHATVSFKVPDNLTTWRVLAVAAAEPPEGDPTNFRFGNGDATFITTQPLLANPLLPQFARPGDLFQGGLATNNTTGAVGTMQINGSLTGALVFDNGGVSSAVVSAQFPAASGTQSQRFPMSVRTAGDATVEFRIALGESGDAFRVPFLVRPLDITESVVETGATTSGAMIPLSIDPDVDAFAGGLQITMASTLLPEILVPAKNCFLFEYLPFAEPLSSRLMVAADMQTLGKKYGQSVSGIDPVAEAADDTVQLAKLQRQDGGFAWWPGQFDSDPYLTGYAAQALGRVQQAGLSTGPVMVTAAHVYLTARLDDPDPHNWCLGYDSCIERMRFEAMLGLAALGDISDKRVGDVYAARDNFDLVTQIELARFMTALPAWKPQADAMARKIQELVYETGRYAVLNTPEDMWWYDSITKGQAETVRLYVAQKYDTAIIDRMVRSLLALRRKGSWANTYDDAQALNALIEYAQLEPEPPAFTATANLNGIQIANNTFNGYRDSVRDTFVGTADLPRGSSDLQLRKAGTGTLHYVVEYSYRLHGPQPGAESGLLISRDVRPVGKEDVVAHMGLAKPPTATTLPVAQVYDVGLTIIADHPVNQVIIVDPLPAGMEAVDMTFNTTPKTQTALYGAWQIDYQVIHHDRVVAFANYLAPGIYTMHYLARTVTPGTYAWPGSQAFLEYAPEEFGRAASTTLTIP